MKRQFRARSKLRSDMIILDPALALRTPDRLWAATGMKLIDHAVERLLATNCNLLSDAQCRCGLASVLHLIEASIGGDTKAAARAALLQVLWLIQSGHGNSRSRAAFWGSSANTLPGGAPKIRDKLIREFPMIKPPAVSTVHAVLDRNGLVIRRKRRRYKAEGTPLNAAAEPNGL